MDGAPQRGECMERLLSKRWLDRVRVPSRASGKYCGQVNLGHLKEPIGIT